MTGRQQLAAMHPLPAEPHIAFEEEGHRYTAWGQRVERSTTRLVDECFAAFDASETVDRFYETWWANAKSKYHATIAEALAAGLGEGGAKAAILAAWDALGAEARRLGTALHLHCELEMNGVPQGGATAAELAIEVAQYEAFKASASVAERALRPYRALDVEPRAAESAAGR